MASAARFRSVAHRTDREEDEGIEYCESASSQPGNGRVYAVTNHLTSNGFIISEVLLYDPNDPNAGMFPAWTARPNAETGSTGFAGYELWRLRPSSQ